MKYRYALWAESYSKHGDYDTDVAEWFECLSWAIEAAQEAIEHGADCEEVYIMKYDTESGNCDWKFPIEFDKQGHIWSDDYVARVCIYNDSNFGRNLKPFLAV